MVLKETDRNNFIVLIEKYIETIRAISQEIPQPPITKLCLEIFFFF